MLQSNVLNEFMGSAQIEKKSRAKVLRVHRSSGPGPGRDQVIVNVGKAWSTF